MQHSHDTKPHPPPGVSGFTPGEQTFAHLIQRTSAPVVTVPAPLPRLWFADFFQRSIAREFYFRELGADPDLCPDFAAFRNAYYAECQEALRPICYDAALTALDWRKRLGIVGQAAEPDAWRMVEVAGFEVIPSQFLKRGGMITWCQGRALISLAPVLETSFEETLGVLAETFGDVWLNGGKP